MPFKNTLELTRLIQKFPWFVANLHLNLDAIGELRRLVDTYHHHAVDALIIAASSQLNLWKKQKNTLVSYSEDQLLDIETGELISDDEYKESVFKAPYQHFC